MCHLDGFLVSVHFLIRTVEYVRELRILRGIEDGKSFCDTDGEHRIVYFYGSVGAVRFESFKQRFAILEIPVLQDDQEFIAADSENGASLEGVGNNLRCGYNKLIARDMTVCIIRFLKIVNVQDDDAEGGFLVLDFAVKIADPLLVGGRVSQTGQGVAVCEEMLQLFVLAQFQDHGFKCGAEQVDFMDVA